MGYRLLIVDDSSATRMIISKVIGLAGVPVDKMMTAGNGQEAIDTMAGNDFDLVITDINMPVMDGIELIRRIKNEPRTAGIPIVVISTEGRDPFVEQALTMGVNSFIQKPFQPEGIRDVIFKALGVQDAPKPRASTETSDF